MLLHRSTKPSHPAGLTSFGWWLLRSKLNNQIELDLPLTWQKSSKIIKKNTIFFSESIPASFRICFRMTTGIHPSMSRTMFRFWMHHIFRHLEAFNHATRRHGSFSFFHVWKKYHGDEFTNRCPFYYFRHNLCYLILLKASSQWGGHPILGFLLDTLW